GPLRLRAARPHAHPGGVRGRERAVGRDARAARDAARGTARAVPLEGGGGAGPVSLRDHAGRLGRSVATASHFTSDILPLPHFWQPPASGRSLISIEMVCQSIPLLS